MMASEENYTWMYRFNLHFCKITAVYNATEISPARGEKKTQWLMGCRCQAPISSEESQQTIPDACGDSQATE